jgi:DNA-directed RNA polymerase subunit RPC12/RpoP
MRNALNIIAAALVAIVGTIFLDPKFRAIWLSFWGTTMIAGALFLLVKCHSRTTAYRCSKCAGEFEIEPLTDFISPHFFNRKYLRCPACGEKVWAREFSKLGKKKDR